MQRSFQFNFPGTFFFTEVLKPVCKCSVLHCNFIDMASHTNVLKFINPLLEIALYTTFTTNYTLERANPYVTMSIEQLLP